MKQYGIGYQGSKSKIADDIIEQLPAGNRLVDLFGGGFAISHCAVLSDKWNTVLYNDINPLLPKLIREAIDGKYNYEVFKPEFITREMFFDRKEEDGYIKWLWSFGNNGDDYLYGRNIEEAKHKIHDYVVFGVQSDLTKDCNLKSINIHDRRIEWRAYCRSQGKRCYLELEHLERLQHLERLEHLERLDFTSMDYHEYEYQDGDIVYCDIPYANTGKNYDCDFDNAAFYEWAKSRPYTVYFSSYEASAPMIWEKHIKSKMAAKTPVDRVERLYAL